MTNSNLTQKTQALMSKGSETERTQTSPVFKKYSSSTTIKSSVHFVKPRAARGLLFQTWHDLMSNSSKSEVTLD